MKVAFLFACLWLVATGCKKSEEAPPVAAPEAAGAARTAGAELAAAEAPEKDAMRRLWLALPDSKNGCPDDFDYFPDGGMRNLACHLKTVLTFDELASKAGGVWKSGPHSMKSGLVFTSERDFGRYDPKFVKWLVANAVPAATDPALKTRTQTVYDRYVGPLARVYLRAAIQLDQNPNYVAAELGYLERYLENPEGKRPLDRHADLEPLDMPNLYAPAVAFWIRRRMDGTAATFREGLDRLIRTYDPEVHAELERLDLRIGLPPPEVPTEAAVPDGPVAQMVSAAWSGLALSKFACTEQFEYRPGGMRVGYCYVKGLLSYERLLKKLSMPIFLSGPHGSGELNLNAERDFGRYNPKFVRWLVDHAVPGARDSKLREASQPAYDDRLKVAARAFYAAHLRLADDRAFFDAELSRYDRFLKEGGEQPFWSYWEAMPGSYEAQAIGGTGVAFWLRRSLDGTRTQFVDGLEKLLTAYDAEFLTEAKKLGFKGLSSRPDFFEGPEDAELIHDDEGEEELPEDYRSPDMEMDE